MKSLLTKLRNCDELLDSILNDSELVKITAEGKDGRKELTELRAAWRTVRDMRLSARLQCDEAVTQTKAG